MKKLLLILLCLPLMFSCGENNQDKKGIEEKEEGRKSWLEQWGYKGKMKYAEYSTYYASMEFGEIRKDSVIDNPVKGIDEWILPFVKVKYNLYGDPIERNAYYKEQTPIFTQELIYANNELNYVVLTDGTKVKAINDQRGYLIKLGELPGAFFVTDDNGYIIESIYSDEIQKHKYDLNGKWIQCDIYDPNTTELLKRTKLSYNKNKREEALIYDGDGNLYERHKYGKYDKENNFTEIIIFDSKDNPLFIIDFTRKYYE